MTSSPRAVPTTSKTHERGLVVATEARLTDLAAAQDP
jgi:hypothetical protein